jgi:phage terminase large subunit
MASVWREGVDNIEDLKRIPMAFKELDDPYRHKAFHGGRGGAKSHSFAQKLLIAGTKQPHGVLCAREIQVSIRGSVKRLLDHYINHLKMQSFYTSTQTEIIGNNGTWFNFAGLRTNPESVKSKEGITRAWIEEANTVSQRSIDLLVPTVRENDSELWWSWNRHRATDPVDKMFLGEKGPPPKSLVRRVNWQNNPYFPDVLRDEMEYDKLRDPDKYAHIWEGGLLMRSGSRVFTNWRIEDIDAFVPDECTPRFGADWGFASDPTVLVKCYVFGRTLYFRAEAYKVKCEIDHIPQLFDTVSEADRYTITADSARPETISYVRRHDYPNIRRALKGPGSVEDGVSFMQSYDIVVHPDCEHVIDELTHYSYKIDPLTDEVLPILEDENNHVIDACRYALEGVRRAGLRPQLDSVNPGGGILVDHTGRIIGGGGLSGQQPVHNTDAGASEDNKDVKDIDVPFSAIFGLDS